MKRDIQGKFALKNDDYRLVRSLRLTDETWLPLGIAAECLGLTRADYLEHMVRDSLLPSITRNKKETLPDIAQSTETAFPCNTRERESYLQENATVISQRAVLLPDREDLLTLRERVLLELKLGKQAPGYKAAQKALAHFIAKLTSPA